MKKKTFEDIDDYIAGFPKEMAVLLDQVRTCIHRAAPNAEEVISYNMPAFRYNRKLLVYFAGFKNHIGFYAFPSSNVAFNQELSRYKTGKGSVQFPLDKELPFDLIIKMVEFRVSEIEER